MTPVEYFINTIPIIINIISIIFCIFFFYFI